MIDTTYKIYKAKTPADLEAARQLFIEYQQGLGVDLCFQSFEEELSGLPGKYAPPEGSILLLKQLIELDKSQELKGEKIAACVALRKHEEGVCEMKRLFVRPEFRGKKYGRLLVQAIIDFAREQNYKTMVLDTLVTLVPALHLYESFDFVKIPAYYGNPLEGVVYMKLDL